MVELKGLNVLNNAVADPSGNTNTLNGLVVVKTTPVNPAIRCCRASRPYGLPDNRAGVVDR